MPTKILFVCSANKQRSRTAEDYFAQKYPDLGEYIFDSAGTNHVICQKEGTNPLTEELLEWADAVFVMEKKHLEIIKKNISKSAENKNIQKIKILRIADRYKYYQPELLEILEEKMENYFYK